MIALLRGEIVHLGSDHLVLDTGGVGYRVFVPESLLGRVGTGQAATLHVSTQVREDAIHLFGFESVADKDTFLVLIAISGVGPRIALSLLSTLGRAELARALARSDDRALQRASGVGKKLAQRLLVELAGKLIPEVETLSPASIAGPARPADPLPLALAQLGYRKAEIDRALAGVEPLSTAPFEERIRAALRLLGGGQS